MDSDRPLLRVLQRVPMPAVIANPVTGKVLWVNKRLADMYGVSDPHVLIGKTLFDFIEPSQLNRALSDLAKVVAGQSPPPVTYQLKRASGEHAAGQVSSVPMVFQGQPAMLSFVADVSEHERLVRELAESEGRHRQLLESLPCGVAVVGDDEVIMYVNKAVTRALGYEHATEVVGQKLNVFVHPQYLASVRDGRKKVLRHKQESSVMPVVLVGPGGGSVETRIKSTLVMWQGSPAIQTLLYDIEG